MPHNLDVEPKGPPPIYRPSVVADCVLYAAEHPVRDLWAGGAGRTIAFGQALLPGLMDALLARLTPLERSSVPAPGGSQGTLFAPRREERRTEGDFGSWARGWSGYTWLQTHPRARSLLTLGSLAGVGAVALRPRLRRSSPHLA